MGRKLDALLGRNFKSSKLKTTVNLAISRLTLLKNHRTARFTIARSDVLQLLRLNHHEQALLRVPSLSLLSLSLCVEQVIKDQNMLDVYDMILGYCHLLIQMMKLIEQAKDCPAELEESVSSLIYAAPRCGEFPELQQIRSILTSRFGKEFANDAIELRSNCGVSQKMVQKLSTRQSCLEYRMKMLMGIAKENGVVLQLETYSPEIEQKKVVVEKKESQLNTEAKVEAAVIVAVLPENFKKVISFSESMKGRKTYRDVADAAEDAFESASYAAAAARAAVELSRLESFGSADLDSPAYSQPRKVLNLESVKSKLHWGDFKSSSNPGYDSESAHEITERDTSERSKHNMKVVEVDGSGSDSDSDGCSDEGNLRSFYGG